jgi:hypothetical protein
MKKQNKLNDKDIRAIQVASRIADLTLTIYNVYNVKWEKAEKMAFDIVRKNTSEFARDW